jgi:hypothetical protein
MVSILEEKIVLYQPVSLQAQCAKKCANEIMIKDNMADILFDDKRPSFIKINLAVCHLIGTFLKDKWFCQFIKKSGSNLFELKNEMNWSTFIKMYQQVLTEMYTTTNPIYKTYLIDLYTAFESQSCQTMDHIPWEILHRGIGFSLTLIDNDNMSNLNMYILSQTNQGLQLLDNSKPPKPLQQLKTINNYTITCIPNPRIPFLSTIERNYLSENQEQEDENSMELFCSRLCWAKKCIAKDRLPEALAHLMSCYVSQLNQYHPVQDLDCLCMLLTVCSRLHLKQEILVEILFHMCDKIKSQFDCYKVVPHLMECFSSLGMFSLVKHFFHYNQDFIGQSIYKSYNIMVYLDNLIEQIENHYVYILTHQQYHLQCQCIHSKKITSVKEKLQQLVVEYQVVVKYVNPYTGVANEYYYQGICALFMGFQNQLRLSHNYENEHTFYRLAKNYFILGFRVQKDTARYMEHFILSNMLSDKNYRPKIIIELLENITGRGRSCRTTCHLLVLGVLIQAIYYKKENTSVFKEFSNSAYTTCKHYSFSRSYRLVLLSRAKHIFIHPNIQCLVNSIALLEPHNLQANKHTENQFIKTVLPNWTVIKKNITTAFVEAQSNNEIRLPKTLEYKPIHIRSLHYMDVRLEHVLNFGIDCIRYNRALHSQQNGIQ